MNDNELLGKAIMANQHIHRNHSMEQQFGVKLWDGWDGVIHPADQAIDLFWHTDTATWYFVIGAIAVPLKDDDMRRLATAIGWVLS